MEAGFNCSNRDTRDGGDLIEGKTFEHMQQQGRSLWDWQLIDEGEQCLRLLFTQQRGTWIGRGIIGIIAAWCHLGKQSIDPSLASELLHTPLMGNSK